MTSLPFWKTARPALAGLAVLLAGSAAQAAPVQFATFNQLANDTSKSFNFTNNGQIGAGRSAMLTYTGISNVSFSFTGIAGLPSGPYTAAVTLTGTATQAASQTALGGGKFFDSQVIDSALLTFKDTMSGKTLLTASFTGSLAGFDGGSSLSIDSSAVTYTSDYLDFGATITRALTFQFNPTSVPTSIAGNGLLSSFSGTGSGQFSSDPPPVVSNGVPEPASLAMLGLGLAGIPVLLRARRRKASIA